MNYLAENARQPPSVLAAFEVPKAGARAQKRVRLVERVLSQFEFVIVKNCFTQR